MKISVFGTGFVGLTIGASLANLGHDVLCIDIDIEIINQLKAGRVPFYEPGLSELMLLNQQKGRLTFSTDAGEGVEFGEIIFNCVGTPSLADGSADLQFIFAVAKTVARFAKEKKGGRKILINKSTVPPGTARKCQEIMDKLLSPVDIVSNPEFLKEGNAVYDFSHPDKIVIGSPVEEARKKLREVYSGFLRSYLKIIETSWETAELIKYANNSFLATKISFINEIANICDLVGGNVKCVAKAIGMDYRIGPKFLNAGLGYAGSCFPKDLRAITSVAHEYGYDARLLKEVDSFNERQKKVLLLKIKSRFGESIKERLFSIWGLTFKPKTSDIREAVSVVLIKELLKLGAKIKVYDPVANKEVKKIFGEQISYGNSAFETVEGSSGIILVTEWDEFRSIDFKKLAPQMKETVIFDGRNIYQPTLLQEAGFTYFGIGNNET